MNYRINTYNRKYIMVDINEILMLSDIEALTSETFQITYNIYQAWLKLIEQKKNQTISYDIALNRDNPLKAYLTTKEFIKKESDKYIHLYKDKEFKQIDLSSKSKVKIRIK